MALTAGTRLGPYEVLGLIGAGGMGEVYRAQDTRLDRTVAIKILPADFSSDPDRRARLEREAKTIATLSHPHICALYDVGEHDGALFLVLEHLEGQTLADRLRKGALPIDQALEYGAQIGEALSVAHRAGIIHRDLKPANVMVTKRGVKLLDFGLAKVRREVLTTATTSTALPVQSEPQTSEGTIAGTLQYMAPEQLDGKAADARTDLWAFGLVLYEAVTGQRAFDGSSSANVIMAIMSAEIPAISVRQPLAPPSLDRLVRRCLAKDPDQRWQSAADCADELRWIGNHDEGVPRQVPTTASRIALIASLLMITAAFAVAVLMSRRSPMPASQPISRVTISLAGAGLTLTDGGVAISPDGQTLVFAARSGDRESQLYARRLDGWEIRPLNGTEGAITPFFAPDGGSVAFVSAGMLKKTQLTESAPQSVRRIQYQGASKGDWTFDNRLIVSNWPGTLLAVPAEGGEPTPLGTASAGARYLWPQLLADGKILLFTVNDRGRSRVVGLDVATSSLRTILESASCARFVPSGHLIYESGGHLLAVAFDPARLQPMGPSRVVVDDITVEEARSNVALGYDVSQSGTLVYLPGSATTTVLVWKDRAGNTIPLPLSPRVYAFPSLSRNGRELTVTSYEWPAAKILVGRVDREPLSQLQTIGSACCSIFSRDARWVFFSSSSTGGWSNLHRVRADGDAVPERLSNAPAYEKPTALSPLGSFLLYTSLRYTSAGPTDRDIVELDLAHAGTARPLVKTPANELEAAISPDGRWIAYQSDESGQFEIYLRPYSQAGTRQRVSISGGMGPVWNPQGGELFYQTRTAIMSVHVIDGQVRGTPTKLFAFRKSEDYRREFDVTPDGQHFLMMEAATPRNEIEVITNWFEELKTKVPTR